MGDGTACTGLTPRELAAVRLVVDGATDREIGTALGITERTARAHLEAARRKLGARSRTQLAVVAIQRSIVPFAEDDKRE